MFGTTKTKDFTPAELRRAMDAGEVVLIDVREPGEYAAERIHGALLYPLSTFDPEALPDPAHRTLVFQCGSGKRSAMAVQKCRAAGLPFDHHLAGGIAAWKQAGLPTVTLDTATGGVRDAR